MYIYANALTITCIYMPMYSQLHVYIRQCTHNCMYIYMPMHSQLYVYICQCTHNYMYIYANALRFYIKLWLMPLSSSFTERIRILNFQIYVLVCKIYIKNETRIYHCVVCTYVMLLLWGKTPGCNRACLLYGISTHPSWSL